METCYETVALFKWQLHHHPPTSPIPIRHNGGWGEISKTITHYVCVCVGGGGGGETIETKLMFGTTTANDAIVLHEVHVSGGVCGGEKATGLKNPRNKFLRRSALKTEW